MDPHASPSLTEVGYCCGILKLSVSVLKLSKGARPVGSIELYAYVLYFFLPPLPNSKCKYRQN